VVRAVVSASAAPRRAGESRPRRVMRGAARGSSARRGKQKAAVDSAGARIAQNGRGRQAQGAR